MLSSASKASDLARGFALGPRSPAPPARTAAGPRTSAAAPWPGRRAGPTASGSPDCWENASQSRWEPPGRRWPIPGAAACEQGRDQLGQIYQCHGDPTRAIAHYREALALAESADEPQLLFPCYDGLATVHLDLGDEGQAEEFMLKAQAVCERAGLEPDALVVLPFLD